MVRSDQLYSNITFKNQVAQCILFGKSAIWSMEHAVARSSSAYLRPGVEPKTTFGLIAATGIMESTFYSV